MDRLTKELCMYIYNIRWHFNLLFIWMNKTIPFASIVITIASPPLVSSSTLLSAPQLPQRHQQYWVMMVTTRMIRSIRNVRNYTTWMISTKSARKHQRLAKYGLRETVRINFFFLILVKNL